MGSKWKRVIVADVCTSIVDCVNKTAPVVEYPTDYKMIRTPNIRAGKVTLDGCRYVEKEVYETWTRRSKPQKGDVLLTREAPLGEVGIITTDENIFLGQRIMQYRADKNKIDPYFLLYSFLSPDLQQQFSMHEGSGSVVSHIRVGDCSKFEINIPPLEIQRSIVEILKSLDDHIDVNIKINQTLEQMAQTLFKSWFVDFDPVIDNALDAGNPIPEALQSRAELRQKVRNSADFKPLPADIRALFPAEFEETELTYAPKGWVTNRLENILELAYGKALKKTERTNGDYPVYGSGGVDGTHNEYLVKGPGIIVGRKGTVGSLHWENKDFYPIDTVFFVKPKEYFPLVYCYQLLKTLGLENMNTDAAVPGLNRNNAYRLEVVTPTQPIIAKFTNIIQAIQFKIDSNHNETENLTALRDTLLPKLISGELSLEDLPDLVTQTEPA
ncbi:MULTISPECIES: restriction endonuclease subunit S [Citrobacter]|uniref:Restriction endonuclease subunit S n=2 Tax=Enterobacteriaceae TaxID=543 RepID=A0ABS1A5B7_9ENTR|nr:MULTISPECIES: restriction endonuclease subunit S [Citrobacter]AWS93849.1 restriction endonuclease subunit S [Citrobacter sp. CRE-46]MBJ8385508.1 restriction endonuclease subunit S [Citrobacter cronae]MBJ8391030.1 restriction endonuclease subunit S [Citrobacter cronae]MBX8967059.1 restriction endonuclease subunit S [Citrobacter werkmanii]MBX9016098.1 restriction endonuclease subunit S [Citrobacter werkmanii]